MVFKPKYRDKQTGELIESRVWWYEFKFSGERIRQSTKQTNKRTAETMEAAHRTNLAKGIVGIETKATAPTLRAFADTFMAAMETQRAESPATIQFYKSKLEYVLKFEPLAAARLDQIDEAAIDAYTEFRSRQISRRGVRISPASVNRELATLRRLLRLAKKRKVIATAPEVKLLHGEHEREFTLTFEQEKLYLAAAAGDLADLGTLMLDTGLRMKEALFLEWPNVHLNPATGGAKYIRVLWQTSKGAKSRNVPLTDRAARMFAARGPKKAGLVFDRGDGQPLYQTWVNQQHSKLRTLLKLPAEFVPHSFRHTYGTRLGAAGVDAFTIMKLMGHSSVTVSQRYVHPTPETMERAVSSLEALNQRQTAAGTERGKVPQEVPKVKNRKPRTVQ